MFMVALQGYLSRFSLILAKKSTKNVGNERTFSRMSSCRRKKVIVAIYVQRRGEKRGRKLRKFSGGDGGVFVSFSTAASWPSAGNSNLWLIFLFSGKWENTQTIQAYAYVTAALVALGLVINVVSIVLLSYRKKKTMFHTLLKVRTGW